MIRKPEVRPQEPAARAARRRAGSLIAAATDAVRRLGKRRSPEALHDFRVSLRRLRTWLNAFGETCGVSAKTRDRLKRLARRTNCRRDAEVQQAWMVTHRTRLTDIDTAALAWLKAHERETPSGDRDDVRELLTTRWPKLARQLRRQLRSKETGQAGESCGQIVARRVRRETTRLRQILSRVKSVHDSTSAHRARIVVKRLRYLLEPFPAESAALRVTVERLVVLQDLLGAWQDRVVLVRTLADAAAQASAAHTRAWFQSAVSGIDGAVTGKEAPGRHEALTGLLRLARMADAEQQQLYLTVRDEWLAHNLASLIGQLRDCARTLTVSKRFPVAHNANLPHRRGRATASSPR